MRRPPIVCRRAVQSLQSPAPHHIWISDELLSSTLHRFSRPLCPHQKRHGSHVPGPLEARRRAAKRRMTLSAGFYPQDNFPSSFSLGALFGYRSNREPAWRYEPPSRQKEQPIETSTLSTRLSDLDVCTDNTQLPQNPPHPPIFPYRIPVPAPPLQNLSLGASIGIPMMQESALWKAARRKRRLRSL
jgi:hypothetical protein